MDGSKSFTRVAGIAVVTAILAATSPAGAADAVSGSESAAVGYADLDLGRSAGIEALYARIVTAAERVCGDYARQDVHAMRDWRRCRRAAIATAVAGVDNAALEALHAGETQPPSERVAAARR